MKLGRCKIKKISLLCMLALLLVSCANKSCDSDNQAYCEILSIENFEIEENAKIKVGLLDERYGKNIIESINEEFEGVYTYELLDEESDLSTFDIIQTMTEDVPLMYDLLRPIPQEFSGILNNDYHFKHSKDVNQEEYFYLPLEIKGILFAYNKTYLKEVNVDISDDEQGLPEAFDSFEKIGELAKKFQSDKTEYLDEEITKVFSFPLNDQSSMISFIENSEYKLIQGISGEDMSVGDELQEALRVFQSLGKYPWIFDEEDFLKMSWDYEEALLKQTSPFMLIGNWMFYEQFQDSQAFDLVFTKLPKLNGYDLETSSSVSGFVLNKDSEFPQAQYQFLKHSQSLSGLQALIESKLIPLANPDLLEELEIEVDKNLKQQMIAYSYSHTPELHAFEKKPSKKAYDLFYEIDFRDVWSDVFFSRINPEEGQKIMLERIDEWLQKEDLERKKAENDVESDHKEGEK